jgi:FMN phosphatase YigB (HAD superfamily)
LHGLILFDFDGTLYRGDAPFRYYAQVLARHMAPADSDRYLSLVEAHLQGVTGIVAGDNWEAVVGLAEPYLADEALWQGAFLETRVFMHGDDCELEVPEVLRTFLQDSHGKVTLACASNSPPEAAIPLMKRLGIYDYFDHVAPSANKPDGLLPYAQDLWGGDLVPERTLSVGDNYKNDIAPALEAGCATAHISPHGYFPGASTAHGHTMEDVMPYIRSWVNNLLLKGD